ncbi:hypothetical protein ACMBCM_05060 [Spiroplasma sp. K1]
MDRCIHKHDRNYYYYYYYYYYFKKRNWMGNWLVLLIGEEVMKRT